MIDDTTASPPQDPEVGPPWLLLIHRIPPKPDYLRVKTQRRLRRLGARALKNSVYVLPRSDEALEDFQWLAREIRAEGGDAMICEASFVGGMSDDDVRALFAEATPAAPPSAAEPERYLGRTWVTRQGVKVDRIASAWLIRRFIDPQARFRFVAARGYRPQPGELRFDMYEAEFTHEGDRCTFEMLLARFGLREAALRAIGEIVHDVDCKDDKFGRAEAGGVAALIAGLAKSVPEDEVRLERGGELFDTLYASLKRGSA